MMLVVGDTMSEVLSVSDLDIEYEIDLFKPHKATNREILDFCREVILKEGRILSRDLYNICKEHFGNRFRVKSLRVFGSIMSELLNGNIIKYRGYRKGKRGMIYATKDERNKKYCCVCGRQIGWNHPFRVCEECYDEAESLVNFFLPLP